MIRTAIRLMSIFLVAVVAASCGSGRAGRVFSTRLSISEYGAACLSANPGATRQEFHFPLLQIYSERGALLYSSHEPVANAAALRSPARALTGLKPRMDAAPLERVIAPIPAFAAHKNEILNSHMPTVLAVSVDGCEACSIQDGALAQTKSRLGKQGFTLLEIGIDAP